MPKKQITRVTLGKNKYWCQGATVWYSDGSRKIVDLKEKQFNKFMTWLNKNYHFSESTLSDVALTLTYIPKQNSINYDKIIAALYKERATLEKALYDIYMLVKDIKGSPIDDVMVIIEETLRKDYIG